MLKPDQRAYIRHLVASASDPKNTMNKTQFADYIGVHPKTLAYWEDKPEFQEALTKAREEFENSSDYFKTCARHKVLEQALVEYEKSKGAERRKWWDKIEALTRDADVSDDTIDYSSLPDEELESLIMGRGLA